MPKAPKAYRFDEETIRLIELLAKHIGDTHTAIIKKAIRFLAKSEKLK